MQAHQRKKEVDVATSEPAMPPATKAEAIAGIRNILAHKTAQAIKAAIGLAKVEGASSGALNVEPGSGVLAPAERQGCWRVLSVWHGFFLHSSHLDLRG